MLPQPLSQNSAVGIEHFEENKIANKTLCGTIRDGVFLPSNIVDPYLSSCMIYVLSLYARRI